MEVETKIFEMGMKIVKVVHMTTEKNDEKIEKTTITLEDGEYSVTLKRPGYESQFVNGEDVIVEILQQQSSIAE